MPDSFVRHLTAHPDNEFFVTVVADVRGDDVGDRLQVAGPVWANNSYLYAELTLGATDGTLQLFRNLAGTLTALTSPTTVAGAAPGVNCRLVACYHQLLPAGTPELIGLAVIDEELTTASVAVDVTAETPDSDGVTGGLGGSVTSKAYFDNYEIHKSRSALNPDCADCLDFASDGSSSSAEDCAAAAGDSFNRAGPGLGVTNGAATATGPAGGGNLPWQGASLDVFTISGNHLLRPLAATEDAGIVYVNAGESSGIYASHFTLQPATALKAAQFVLRAAGDDSFNLLHITTTRVRLFQAASGELVEILDQEFDSPLSVGTQYTVEVTLDGELWTIDVLQGVASLFHFIVENDYLDDQTRYGYYADEASSGTLFDNFNFCNCDALGQGGGGGDEECDNLVKNGDFRFELDGWTYSAGVTWVSEAAHLNFTGPIVTLQQTVVGLTPGAPQDYSFEIRNVQRSLPAMMNTSLLWQVFEENGTTLIMQDLFEPPTEGVFTGTFTPEGGTVVIKFSLTASGQASLDIDNVELCNDVPDESSSSDSSSSSDDDDGSSSSSLVPPDDEICSGVPDPTDDPDGRVQIAVDQPQGGSHYPFIFPDDDIELLIADLYLYFVDDRCQLAPPFRISWLSGFGSDEAVNPTGMVHDYDLQIVDAEDQVVFDSRDASVYRTVEWAEQYLIIEWATADEVLRVVIFRSWSPEQDSRTWPCYFEPGAVLDPRSHERAPKLVRAISLVTDAADPAQDVLVTTEDNLLLQAGYNVLFVASDLSEGDGHKRITGITVDSAPGLGLGRYPGCEPILYIRRLNDVTADDGGNLIVDAGGCYRIERPVTHVVTLEDTNDDGVPDTEVRAPVVTPPEAVHTEGWREVDVAANTLKVSNDCGPCCDCQDFINVYEAIRRLQERYVELAARAEAARDLYRENRERWEEQRSCRAAETLRLALQPLHDCRLAVAAAICNNTEEPLQDVTLQLDFSASTATGCVVCHTTFRRGNTDPAQPIPASRLTPYQLGGAWPVYTAHFDCINPGENGYVTFLLNIPGCSPTDRICLEATAPGLSAPAVSACSAVFDDSDMDDCCDSSTGG